jgi:hypothetical protein
VGGELCAYFRAFAFIVRIEHEGIVIIARQRAEVAKPCPEESRKQPALVE